MPRNICFIAAAAAALLAAPVRAQHAEEPALSPSASALLSELLQSGATMEEIARCKEPKLKTPAQAIHELKAGNARFFSGRAPARAECSGAARADSGTNAVRGRAGLQ